MKKYTDFCKMRFFNPELIVHAFTLVLLESLIIARLKMLLSQTKRLSRHFSKFRNSVRRVTLFFPAGQNPIVLRLESFENTWERINVWSDVVLWWTRLKMIFHIIPKQVRLISKGFRLDLTKKVIPYKEKNLKNKVFKPSNGWILLLQRKTFHFIWLVEKKENNNYYSYGRLPFYEVKWN